jgi:hypothetical protein
MPSIRRFLDEGTVDLRRDFEYAPEIQRLLLGHCPLAAYRKLLEGLRRGFAVVELQAFEDLPDHAQQVLRAKRSTWRLSHDIGILGGTVPLPARQADIDNAGAIDSWSAKLGAHFAIAHILEILSRAQTTIEKSFGCALVSCLLFTTGPGVRFTAVEQLIDHAGPDLDWAEALAGARRTLRTIRQGLVERGPTQGETCSPAEPRYSAASA